MTPDQHLQYHQDLARELADAAKSGDRVDAFSIARPLRCDMGHWLHHEGMDELGDGPLYREAVERHNDFHKAAELVAKAINVRSADSQRMMAPGSTFAIALNGLEMLTIKLNRALKGQRVA